MEESIKNKFVVDASFVVSYMLPDENMDEVDRRFHQFAEEEITFYSTLLLPFEVVNSLRVAILRKRIPQDLATELINRFLCFNIHLEEISFNQIFSLANQEDLTIYDASYATLAQNKNIPLLTLDKRLKKLAEK